MASYFLNFGFNLASSGFKVIVAGYVQPVAHYRATRPVNMQRTFPETFWFKCIKDYSECNNYTGNVLMLISSARKAICQTNKNRKVSVIPS